MVSLSGQPLRALRDTGMSDEQLISWAAQARNITRVDYALDVLGDTPEPHSPEGMRAAYHAKKIKTRMRLDSSHKDEKVPNGYTISWGAVSSNQRVVIYDKENESKQYGEAWTRIELRCRKEQAKALVQDMDALGVVKGGDARLKRYFNANVSWYKQALEDNLPDPTEVRHKEPNYRKWLMEVVLPSIRNNIDEHRPTIDEFISQVVSAYNFGLDQVG